MKKAVLILSALTLSCAHQNVYDKTRAAVLDIHLEGLLPIKTGEGKEQNISERSVRSVLESALLKHNVTVVDDAEFHAVMSRYGRGEATGLHTTATTAEEYQPAATHGIIIDVVETTPPLGILTLGLWPYSVETSARMIDLRTGEVRASVKATTHGMLWIWSARPIYRGVRKISQEIAETLNRIQEKGRHLRPKDWQTPYQTEDTDPRSPKGRKAASR